MNKKLITNEHLEAILPSYKEVIKREIDDEVAAASIEPAEGDIPSVFISGEVPIGKTYVNGELEYISKTERFISYIYYKLQGKSSLDCPKKNYTIAMYSDEGRICKLNKNFRGWGMHNNYVLKANYTDILQARNVVCAKLWGNVVRSRPDFESLPDELKNSPNCGAIDGFPVKVYLNGIYQGLYSWNIPKCDWQFGIDNTNPDHALINAEISDMGDPQHQYNPCNFNRVWKDDGDYPDAWSIEEGCADRGVIQSCFNAILMARDEVGLPYLYLDKQSVIDYYIFQDVIFGTDGLANNMLLVTYDMKYWYMSAYDMDATFDLSWDGKLLDRYDAEMPDGYNNQYSALLNDLPGIDWEEVVERYTELRKTVLSYASVVDAFDRYIGAYGEDLYFEDTAVWPDIPSATTNTLKYLKEFTHRRLQFLDNKYGVEVN